MWHTLNFYAKTFFIMLVFLCKEHFNYPLDEWLLWSVCVINDTFCALKTSHKSVSYLILPLMNKLMFLMNPENRVFFSVYVWFITIDDKIQVSLIITITQKNNILHLNYYTSKVGEKWKNPDFEFIILDDIVWYLCLDNFASIIGAVHF